jgi:hypothetical protein
MDITIPVTIKEGGERSGPFNDLIGATIKNAEITLHITPDVAQKIADTLQGGSGDTTKTG